MILRDFQVVTEPADAALVAQELAAVPSFALDLETSGLDFNRSSIHGVALASESKEWYVCRGAEKALLPLLHDLVKDKQIIGHNLAFDLHFLGRYGIRPKNIADTMVGQFLVDENQGLGLKSLAHTRLGILEPLPDFKQLLHEAKRLTGRKKLAEVSIYDVPLDALAEYAGRDARLTYDLWSKTAYDLDQQGLYTYFFEVEMPFVHVLVDMEEAGFWIDQRLLRQLGSDFHQRMDDALKRWMEISQGVNPNSPKQLQQYLYETMGYQPTKFTELGAPGTDILSLNRLLPQDKNGAIRALIDYRKYDKLISTYITTFEEQLYNGRLYGNFNHTGTATGRLSSSSPNLPNIPAHGEAGGQVRELFAVPPGYKFVDVDYGQVELRLTAHYTKDPNLLRVFAEGGDPHQLTADLCGVTRSVGKTLNFASLYGSGPRSLADTVEKSGKPRPTLKETMDWLDRFARAYPEITRWKRRVIEYAAELGYVRTIAGRRRRLPDIRSFDKALRAAAERQAVNTIIQASAADIIKWAMLQLHPLLPEYGAKMLAQVHDELAFEVPEAAAQEFAAKAQAVMEAAGEQFKLRLKLSAEPGIGDSWGSAKH
jgi:DNA polymerase-1